MEENNQKQYKYKMDKVERYFSFAILAIFFVSFNGSAGFVLFTIFTLIVLAYYFKFYMRKPLYLRIDGDEVQASQGVLFKLKTFKIFEIDIVNKYENKIELKLKQGEKIVLMKILLSDSDYKEIYEELSRGTSEILTD